MRLAFVAVTTAAVFAATSGQAQNPGRDVPNPEAGRAIKALIGANFADNHCPHYRIVASNILALLRSVNVAPDEVRTRYASFTETYALKINRDFDSSPAEFCDFLIETYGPRGAIPDLIERE